jgi:DNA-binding NtrC family response regulator
VGRGTLFLDEIGNLPADCQPAFLRLLENRTYNRLGDTVKRTFEGRIIAATHPTLRDKVQRGEFMEDLAYRLDRFVIDVPPLRECPSDIPLLRDHFLAEYAEKYSKNRPLFSRKALQRFMSYTWPGNVRQMQNVIRDAVVSFSGGEINEVRLEGLIQRHSWVLSKDIGNANPSAESQSPENPDELLRKACEMPENHNKKGRPVIEKLAEHLKLDRHTVSIRMKALGLK